MIGEKKVGHVPPPFTFPKRIQDESFNSRLLPLKKNKSLQLPQCGPLNSTVDLFRRISVLKNTLSPSAHEVFSENRLRLPRHMAQIYSAPLGPIM